MIARRLILILCLALAAVPAISQNDPDAVVQQILDQVVDTRTRALSRETYEAFWALLPRTELAELAEGNQAMRQGLIDAAAGLRLETVRSMRQSFLAKRYSETARYRAMVDSMRSLIPPRPELERAIREAEGLIARAVEHDRPFDNVDAIDMFISRAEAAEHRVIALTGRTFPLPERWWVLERVRAAVSSAMPFVLSIDPNTIFAADQQTSGVTSYLCDCDEGAVVSVGRVSIKRVLSGDELRLAATAQYDVHATPYTAQSESFRGWPSVVVSGGPTMPGDKDQLVTRFAQDPVSYDVIITSLYRRKASGDGVADLRAFEATLKLY